MGSLNSNDSIHAMNYASPASGSAAKYLAGLAVLAHMACRIGCEIPHEDRRSFPVLRVLHLFRKLVVHPFLTGEITSTRTTPIYPFSWSVWRMKGSVPLKGSSWKDRKTKRRHRIEMSSADMDEFRPMAIQKNSNFHVMPRDS